MKRTSDEKELKQAIEKNEPVELDEIKEKMGWHGNRVKSTLSKLYRKNKVDKERKDNKVLWTTGD